MDSLGIMELELSVRIETFDVVDGCFETKAACGRDIRLECLHQSNKFLLVFLSLLHVADGQVDGDEYTEVTIVGVLCVCVCVCV